MRLLLDMVLVSPHSTAADAERHHQPFRDAVELLFAKELSLLPGGSHLHGNYNRYRNDKDE